MEGDIRKLVSDYISCASAKDWPRLAELVHEDATFGGTIKGGTSGREAFIGGFQRLAPIYLRYERRQVLIDGTNAAVLYDFVTDTPAGKVLSAEFLTTDGRQITSSTLLFDLRQWPDVLQELMRRTSEPAPAPA